MSQDLSRTLCENCGLAPAAVRLEVQNQDGENRMTALCWGCVANLSAELSLTSPKEAKICPQCGTTWKSFRKDRVFGCPTCYRIFAQEIQGWLGKKSLAVGYGGPGPKQNQKRRELEEALAKALGEERYEDAARLRDRLKTLGEQS